ncbi:MAG: hypothetical protein IPJ61_19870 [Tessaracoccus sp.]|uniref:hypothetical protein n=1 Tax=Tessaracoccus sp. TaxID=1971211 RepID=UPI001EB27F4D|nr:hypothetical protein [Tessaracoccus sp.]MBK7823245.1 hypothetical protein [Tessaracoccus sp.]
MVTQPARVDESPGHQRTVEEWWRYLACELEPDGSVGMSLDGGDRLRVTPLIITRGARRDRDGRLAELRRGAEGAWPSSSARWRGGTRPRSPSCARRASGLGRRADA